LTWSSSESFANEGFLFGPGLVAAEYFAAEFEEVGVDKVPPDAIGDVDIFPSVIVKVGDEDAPAPVCGFDARQLSYLAKKGNAGVSGPYTAVV